MEAKTLRTTVTRERLARVPAYLRAVAGMVRPSFIAFLPVWIRHGRHARGWLRMPDAFLLFRLAKDGPGEGEIVEIGSAWGRSTICLGAGSRAARREHVTAIDPHTGDSWFLQEEGIGGIDSFAEFSRNIDIAGLQAWVTPIVMTSEAAAAGPSPSRIRLLFIDGLHTFDGVQQDIDDWVPRVPAGGIVVFDDYDNTAEGVGVRTAVDRLLASGLVEPVLYRSFNLVWMYRAGSASLT